MKINIDGDHLFEASIPSPMQRAITEYELLGELIQKSANSDNFSKRSKSVLENPKVSFK
jgi:hypothetical protein